LVGVHTNDLHVLVRTKTDEAITCANAEMLATGSRQNPERLFDRADPNVEITGNKY